CTAPWRDCNNDPGDGCELDVQSDVAHCGGCNNACAPVANGSPACASGQCAVGSCDGTFLDCDHDYSNGCETDVSTDMQSCGFCNNSCGAIPGGATACLAGQCAIAACNGSLRDCNARYADGC